jgi:hypothetical protein
MAWAVAATVWAAEAMAGVVVVMAREDGKQVQWTR